MADWVETCRSSVAPWECDVTEHFTIAYYFDRLEQAAISLATPLGLDDHLRAGVWPRRLILRFVRELRAGSSFHIESAALALDPALRLGHRFVDSANGEVVTWIEEVWESAHLSDDERSAVSRHIAAWDGPEAEQRPEPAFTSAAIATARGVVRPADLDGFGRLSLAAYIHKFTDAVIQASAAIGMTAEYIRNQRRGYSTFELTTQITGAPAPGAPYLVETGIAHLGNSSIRLLHRLLDPRDGREFARLGQFGVQLDLDARRPAALPPEMRAAAARLLLPAAER